MVVCDPTIFAGHMNFDEFYDYYTKREMQLREVRVDKVLAAAAAIWHSIHGPNSHPLHAAALQ